MKATTLHWRSRREEQTRKRAEIARKLDKEIRVSYLRDAATVLAWGAVIIAAVVLMGWVYETYPAVGELIRLIFRVFRTLP